MPAPAARRASTRSRAPKSPVFRHRQQARPARPAKRSPARHPADPRSASGSKSPRIDSRRAPSRGRQQEQAVVDPFQRGNPRRRRALQRRERVLAARIRRVEHLVADRPARPRRREFHKAGFVRLDLERRPGQRRPRGMFVAAQREGPHIDAAPSATPPHPPRSSSRTNTSGFMPGLKSVRFGSGRRVSRVHSQLPGRVPASPRVHRAQRRRLRPQMPLDRQTRVFQRPRRRSQHPQKPALHRQNRHADRQIVRPSRSPPRARRRLGFSGSRASPKRPVPPPRRAPRNTPSSRPAALPASRAARRRQAPCSRAETPCAQDHRATSRRALRVRDFRQKRRLPPLRQAPPANCETGMSEITINPSSSAIPASAACKSCASVPAARSRPGHGFHDTPRTARGSAPARVSSR